jgi:glycosyltransferase involved in cell wall biosynthesis
VRIALVGPAHPYKGGGARHTTELAHRLAAAGHEVIVESWRAQYPRRLYPGQQTVDVPEGEPYPRTRRRLAWYRPDGWLAAGRRARSADLVVFALLTPLQVPPYLAIMSRLGREPRTAVICHNVLPHERRPGDVALTRALLDRAGTVITHSAAQAAQARELAPGATVRTVTMPPHLPATGQQNQGAERAGLPATPQCLPGGATPPDPPAQCLPGGATPPDPPAQCLPGGATPPDPPAQCRLLFFGIVRPYKGLDVLLRALARAPEHVTLTVAGEFWGDITETDNLIAELGLAGRVTLCPGYLPADQIPALFGAADALVMPYREATASQNALLAFAHGVPVITTTAGALAEQVRDGVDGLTCAPGDTEDLLRALKEISDPEVARRLRAEVRPVDPEPGWAAYLRVLLAG